MSTITSSNRLDVVVYYDDMLLKQYKDDHDRVKGKLRAVMAFVKEMYSERDTLKTEIRVNILDILHADGHNLGIYKWRHVSFTFFLL